MRKALLRVPSVAVAKSANSRKVASVAKPNGDTKPARPKASRQADGAAISIRDQVLAFKRDQIIAAAVDLFFEDGYQRTTLDAVARRLNFTKPFIYYHFEDKEAILVEISRRSIVKANAALAEALAATGRPTERLHSVIRSIMRNVLEARHCTAIFFREQKNLSEQARGPLYRQHQEFDAMLVQLLKEGMHTGEFTVTDPALCALAIAGMVGWGYNWYRPGGRLSADAICDGMAEMVLRMVETNPGDVRRPT
jgi:AcrR family transcriptional regulator